jgi:hypothetical protein
MIAVTSNLFRSSINLSLETEKCLMELELEGARQQSCGFWAEVLSLVKERDQEHCCGKNSLHL